MKLQALLILLLIMAMGTKAYGKGDGWDDAPKPFTGGIAAGLNFAQVDGDQYFGYVKPGISAGLYVAMHFTETVGMQMDLLFSQKGSHGDAVLETAYGGTTVSQCHIGLNYVELPLVFQYRYKWLTLEAGGSYAVLVGTNEWILAPQDLYIDKTGNRFNGSDLNYVFGISGKVYKKLYANVRFQYSVLSIRPYERIPIGYGYGTEGQFNNLFCARILYEL